MAPSESLERSECLVESLCKVAAAELAAAEDAKASAKQQAHRSWQCSLDLGLAAESFPAGCSRESSLSPRAGRPIFVALDSCPEGGLHFSKRIDEAPLEEPPEAAWCWMGAKLEQHLSPVKSGWAYHWQEECPWQLGTEAELAYSGLGQCSSFSEANELCQVMAYDRFEVCPEIVSHQRECMKLQPEQVLPCSLYFHSISLRSFEPAKIIRIPRSDSDAELVFWIVEAKKLKGKNRLSVSPSFSVRCSNGRKALINISLDPLGGKNFLESQGIGRARLKCETDLADSGSSFLTFSLGLCSGRGDGKWEVKRGPITWDLSRRSTCEFSEDQQAWDFGAPVDDASQTLAVCVELQGQMPPNEVRHDATASDANQLLWPT